jgi:hypothetical protein
VYKNALVGVVNEKIDSIKLQEINNVIFFRLKGEVNRVEVRKIATFVVNSIKSNLLLLKVEFEVSVPEIVAEGEHYAIEGNLGGLLPVYGEGRLA